MLEMKFDFDGLIQLLAKNLYSEKHVFIRELIQNAHDAIIRRRAQEGDAYSGKISIESRPDDLQFIIKDTGIGMNDSDLKEYLSTIGKGATRLARQEQKTEGLIGLFGIGFLSAFVVASQVEVKTRRLGDTKGWIWRNSGNKDYTLEECDVAQAGTTITVFLKGEEEKGVIHEEEVKSVIRRYADFLAVPIHLNGSNRINSMGMPWEQAGRSPAEIEFDTRVYLEKTMRDSVLEVIPVQLPDLSVSGALYITRTRVVQRTAPRAIRLFVNRMFICEKETELVPEWAQFVNGVICAQDGLLTLTAARDNFIRDENLNSLQTELGNIIVRHMEDLAANESQRFSEILRYHDFSIKAACHYYDEFFDKFADLLEWRTNKGYPSAYIGDFVPERRTLPEILKQVPRQDDEVYLLPYVSDRNAANQYYQMADAAKTLVVDASYFFETELIKAYAERAKGRIKLIAVDREDDPNVFRELQEDTDLRLKQLAEFISQVVRPGGTGRVRAEARYFEPKDLTVLIRATEASMGTMKANDILNDPNTSQDLREMAQEMLRLSRNSSLRFILNASNPMLRRLAQQDFKNPDILNIIRGICNSAILYNQELMTPQNSRVFYEQFQQLLGRTLDLIIQQEDLHRQTQALEKEREELRNQKGRKDETRHLIFFLMTPFDSAYRPFIETVRDVVENRFGCQLFVASDRQYQDTIIDNVRYHMDQAHAFIAEVTDANPNVMLELGAARFDLRERPIVLMRRNNKQQLPVDLRGWIYVNYEDKTGQELADYLETQLRSDHRIISVLNKKGRELYISPKFLEQIVRLPQIEGKTWQLLAEKYPTREMWEQASEETVKSLLGQDNEDMASVVLNRIHKGISNIQE